MNNVYGLQSFEELMSKWDDKDNQIIRWTMGPEDEGTHVATGMKQWFCGNVYGYVHNTPLLWDSCTGALLNTDLATHYLPPSEGE